MIEWLFIITGAMTVAYMTKLFIVLFVEKNSDPEIQKKYEAKMNYCNKVTAAVLAITATILPNPDVPANDSHKQLYRSSSSPSSILG